MSWFFFPLHFSFFLLLVLLLLLPYMDIHKSLQNAIYDNKIPEVEAILKNNPDLDLHTKGEQVEHFYLAILLRRREIVKLFLNSPGVDLNKTNRFGHTVLWKAISGGDVEVLKLLLRDQRLKYLPDHEGTSPLYLPLLFWLF